MRDFYVGYVPQAPPALARFIRRVIVSVGFVALSICLTLLAGQTLNAPKIFEYGIVRSWEGTLRSVPYPVLIPHAGSPPYLLVGQGKHGLAASGLDGNAVRLNGTLIQFGQNRMLQVESLNADPGTTPANLPAEENLGLATLEGEIVDTKCFFGVMQPGNGKVHRACASRCIAGGIPPGLLVHASNGQSRVVLLASRDGKPLRELKRWVAETRQLTGTLVRTPGGLVLRTNF